MPIDKPIIKATDRSGLTGINPSIVYPVGIREYVCPDGYTLKESTDTNPTPDCIANDRRGP